MLHDMKEPAEISPLAGKPAPTSMLVNLARLEREWRRCRRAAAPATTHTHSSAGLGSGSECPSSVEQRAHCDNTGLTA